MSLGINGDEKELYTLLLRRPSWTMSELASAWPGTADGLAPLMARLRQDRLAVASADVIGGWRAVEPRLALPSLVAVRLWNGRTDAPSVESLESFVHVHELSDQRIRHDSPPSGLDQAASIVERLVASARLDVLMTVPDHHPASYEFCEHVHESVLRRGGRLRLLWRSQVAAQVDRDFVRWLSALGIRPRLTHAPLPRVVVVDHNTAMIATTRQIQVLRASEDVRTVRDTLTPLWAGTDTTDDVLGPTTSCPRRARILHLLADGNTDDAIARQLGCSVRTVRTEVASTMAGLRAKSRFQAGMMAMRLGLI
ncbi:MAG: hypothetical protein QG671_1489 [Actinomycetota bacterium]|nr:hypothetical protein [Actinomycetota bacterium]